MSQPEWRQNGTKQTVKGRFCFAYQKRGSHEASCRMCGTRSNTSEWAEVHEPGYLGAPRTVGFRVLVCSACSQGPVALTWDGQYHPAYDGSDLAALPDDDSAPDWGTHDLRRHWGDDFVEQLRGIVAQQGLSAWMRTLKERMSREQRGHSREEAWQAPRQTYTGRKRAMCVITP